MKKLLKLLFVRRQETKDKWWHRLALVLIYGSTIVGAIFLGSLLVTEEAGNWVTKSYTAYSFEEGYETAQGKEMDCKFSVLELSRSPVSFFRCGDFSDTTEFLEKYSRARGTYAQLEELRLPRSGSGLYLPVAERQGKKTDEQIMVQLIQDGELDNIKVKQTASFDYVSFFGNWGIYLLIVLGWLVFWESIVYRTLLFIVYGKKND
ncbi:hypothetical protein COX69_02330 [Candidatus Falkowbacteria bacterium CG_4_10_14_0_2_um_filter_48_10]|nr:MAG: hypothetical protein COX69_02330 [Candidatus Falkowbacteria bacterium CG_4_10_14_0_2_um_filter_48_10]